MIKIPCGDQHYWMDGLLKSNLDDAKQIIQQDWDFLYVIDGEAGSGKSVFAQQVGYYVSDGKLNIHHINFDPEDFRKTVLEAKKYDAIIMDEAFRGLSSRSSLSKVNRAITTLLNEIRQKNLWIFICIPSMWDLDKYVTMHRCQGVFHVHTVKKKIGTRVERERGHVRYYNKETIRYFIGNSPIRYVYPKKPNLFFTFKEFYPVNQEEYRKKKAEALGKDAYQKDTDPNPAKFRRLSTYERVVPKLMQTLYKIGYSKRQLALVCGINTDTVRILEGGADGIIPTYNPQVVENEKPSQNEPNNQFPEFKMPT